MVTKFCIKCGTPYQLDTLRTDKPAFCRNCGAQIYQYTTSQQETESEDTESSDILWKQSDGGSNTSRKIVVGSIIILLIGTVVLGLWYFSKNRTVKAVEVATEEVTTVSPETDQATEASINLNELDEEAHYYEGEAELVPGISEHEAFCYFIGVYNKNPDENIYTGSLDPQLNNRYKETNTWTKIYLDRLDTYTYQQAKNDEFKFFELLNSTTQQIKSDIQQLNFNNQYTIIIRAKMGEYDFNNSAFPIFLDIDDSGPLFSRRISDNSSSGFISLQKITNILQFDAYNTYTLKLNMDQSNASQFIETRKNKNTGYIDRTVYIKLTYSIENQQVNEGSMIFPFKCYTGLAAKAHVIEIWSDQYASENNLGQINKISA